MGYFFFDESIHEGAGFIVGAFVYTEIDPTSDVHSCINEVGLNPGHDEFKSSSKMISNPKQVELRHMLQHILNNAKIGLVILPANQRAELGTEALSALNQIISKCNIQGEHDAFFDQEISTSLEMKSKFQLDCPNCELHFHQDSKKVAGIQLADLTAHTLGIMLREQMGLFTKKIIAGESSGYEPDLEIELGFAMWAGVRHAFFHKNEAHGDYKSEQIEMTTFDVNGYGLYISKSCNAELTKACEDRFGTTYLGCIH